MNSVYHSVNTCVDCEQEIFSPDWEPVLLSINGEKIHTALCHSCMHAIYTVRAERIAEEPDLLAILFNGCEVLVDERKTNY